MAVPKVRFFIALPVTQAKSTAPRFPAPFPRPIFVAGALTLP
jgi:hypothetical protein